MKKLGKILRGVLIGVVLLLLLLWVGVTVLYWPYFSNSQADFFIPGLMDGFVPQGFDYIAEEDTYLICGYMKDGSNSRVYVRESDGNTFYVELCNEDGSNYDKHAGGLCWNDEYLYVSGDSGIDVFSLTEVLADEDPEMMGTIDVGYDTAYCSFYNGYLLLGNFYYPEAYETPENQRITTPAGDNNTSLLVAFAEDETAEFGVDPEPVAAFSTPDKVQGICFTAENEIVLSTSWSINSSHLYFHEIDLDRTGTVEVCDKDVPLYYLDSETLSKDVSVPPMSEELVYKDGRVFVMCESACTKYIFGNLIRGYRVFGYDADAA